jgi:hypothetical protein
MIDKASASEKFENRGTFSPFFKKYSGKKWKVS